MRLHQIRRFFENCIFYILFRHVFVTYHLFLDRLNFEVGVSVGVGEEFCPPTFLTVLKTSCNSRVILLVKPFVYTFLQPETSTLVYTPLVVILLSVLPVHVHLMNWLTILRVNSYFFARSNKAKKYAVVFSVSTHQSAWKDRTPSKCVFMIFIMGEF